MKGKISIGEFIHKVKEELVQAQDRSGEPFYELTEVNLEISFALDISAKTGFDLYVLELGGASKAKQTHKVALKLKPLPRVTARTPNEQPGASDDDSQVPAKSLNKGKGSGGGGGGAGFLGRHGPVYDRVRDE